MRVRLIVAVAIAAVLSLSAAGCSGTKQAVKQAVQGGVETTTTGPHNVVPANDAQNAVDQLNKVQQTEQQAAGADQQ